MVHFKDMNPVDFEFIPPPEAPVFEPTVEEFKDPLAYIAKIRPIAEQTGICKIKPPPDWQPGFAVDTNNFRFTPRMQRLNELEATTRVKLNFLDQIAKFWELQGSSLKIPNVERKALDLFTLYRVVLEEGGSDMVSRDRRWSRIATRMGYPPGRGVGSLLRQHYERILYPYHVFQEGTSITDLNLNEDSDGSDKQDRDYVPHGIPSRQAIKPPPDRYARRSKRRKDVENCTDDIDYSTNSELKKLQFYGAGPKMPGFHAQGSPGCDENKEALLRENHLECFKDVKLGQGARNLHMAFSGVRTEEAAKLGSLLKKKDRPKGKTPIEQIVCTLCKRGDEEASMLLCDGCDDSYHTFCLIPPLNEIPKGDWRCPCCVAKVVNKPQEAFGFEQAQREYTLQEFGNKADEFKNSYFGMPAHRVPYELLEKEFWRVVNAVDEDVTVEYGADLHTIEHGSGFPTSSSIELKNKDVPYINSGWNLNNLPVLEGSVLRHINADISGMKIPWTYVGMCFATFCWHNEDHWSYSINYLHWGEPKTWYGVPGGKAETFEEAMRSLAPELFNAQPDLLHQLVTIMNPNLLISQGVPICRTNQLAGEFVITFPRSYHAGFNQGYNFAEAVNFAPADWLPIGRVCVSHYGMLHRFCVFSHDELVCKMASEPDALDVSIAASTYQDMLKMVEAEKEQRKTLLEWGVTQANREVFELLPDDERQCEYCKTTCFLSAVTCPCQENKLVCIAHRAKLCLCPPEKHCLLYRYTLDELPNMLYRLKVRAESFDTWSAKLQDALSSKLSLVDLKELVQESEEKHFPQNDLLQTATAIIEEAEKCTALAQQLLSRRVRTRTRHSGETRSSARLTLEDLQLFHHQLSTLSCEVKETFLVKDLLDRAIGFENTARDILEEDNIDPKKLEKCLETGLNLDIDIAEIPQLRQRLQQSRWLEEVKGSLSSDVTLEVLRHLLDKGVSVPPHPTVEKVLAELQELLTFGEKWEEKAKQCLSAKPKHPLSLLETVVREAGNISVKLPNVQQLMETVSMSKEWLNRVQSIQNGTHNPYLEVLEYLVSRGRPIHARLEPLPTIENQVEAAKAWRDKTARTFLKKNTHYTLLEVLSPRKDIGIQGLPKGKKKRKELDENSNDSLSVDIKFEDTKDPATIVASFKEAERRELEGMLLFRHKNERKYIEENPEARFCICLKVSTNNMVRCDLCKDWFHTSCALSGNSKRDVKFLCPLCLRSRRPRLETILSLLVSLQKLPVRLPEGEALQCLTERGMSWQDRAKQSLKSEEVASALNTLHRITQQKSELAYSEKSEQITTSELRKADILNRWRSLSMSQPESPNENLLAPEIPTVPTDVDMVDLTADASLNADTETSGSYSSEHAYSTASKTLTTSTSSVVTPRKHARKSPLVARQTEPPVLHLSEGARAHLEQLMVEGDLLEITLDESRDITKLLRATRSQREASPSFSDIEDNPKPERKKIKKPKIDKPKGTFLKSKLTKSKNKLKQFQNPQDKPKKKKKKLQLSQLLSGDIKHKKGPKDVIKKGPREKKGPKGTLRENEPDDLCSAGSCLRPVGEAVDWVQCDGGCELWFHLLCVGLDVTQVSENEDYICPHCRSQNAPLDEMAASVLASFAQRTLQDTPSIRE